jgi:hypothetical protein
MTGTNGSTTFNSNTLRLTVNTTTIDITTLSVSKILTSADSNSLHTDVSLNSGNIYTGDLRDPKQGLAFNYIKYHGSRTEYAIDGSYIVARTDGIKRHTMYIGCCNDGLYISS